MYDTKLKGRDGIAVYKSLHFSPDYIGNFPEVGETHVDGGCHWRVFRKRINESFMFLVEIFHDAAIKVCFGVFVFYQHAFHLYEFIVYGIKCTDDFMSLVKQSKHKISFLVARNETCPMRVEARIRFSIRFCLYSSLTFFY